MADHTIKRTGRLALMLLSYIVGRLADDPDPSRTSGTGLSIRLVHDDIRAEAGIKDKRTWLKHLRRLESEHMVDILCYGKNQYSPTVVRPGEMLWHCQDDEMLWQKYGGCIANRPHLPSDVHAMAQRSKTDVSKRSCYGIPTGRTSACRQKMRKLKRSDAMACSAKNAIAPKRNAIAKTQNAMAKSRNAVAFSPATAMPWQKTSDFCYGTTVSHTWRPDDGFELDFCNYIIINGLQNSDNDRYIINIKYSNNKKSLNLKVGSVLSFTDSGENLEKGTHTCCDTKTERGRRKEKAVGSRRGRKTEAAVPQPVDQALCKPVNPAPRIALDAREDGNVWLQWVRTTANRMSLDEDAFSAFSDKWLARARLNGKLVKYQSHSIKDFIIQDFMKEQTDKCNEAAMAAAIQSSTPTAAAPVAMPAAAPQQQGLRIPRGVILCNRWGRLQEKQLELRGIAENYAYSIAKILRGRGDEVGLGTLMELHDIFRLNIPGYAARYQGIGHDDARGYRAAEQWIFELARCGYSPANILQQAGF